MHLECIKNILSPSPIDLNEQTDYKQKIEICRDYFEIHLFILEKLLH